MTKTELADKLNHLDPGATLRVQQVVLASLFGAGGLSKEAVVLDHRCTFSVEQGMPTFEKDHIF